MGHYACDMRPEWFDEDPPKRKETEPAQPTGEAVASLKMPRRKREALQRRHDYLRGIPHAQRNTYDEAEIAALDWVLHRFKA